MLADTIIVFSDNPYVLMMLFNVLLLLLGSWLLFRAVAIVVVGLFADAIVADVEGRMDRLGREAVLKYSGWKCC